MWINIFSKANIITLNSQFKYAYNFSSVSSKAKQQKKTYYQILEVPISATMVNIKQNYLKLAKIYHPDVYKGKDKQRFQKIQQAYKTLSDKIKRNKYDQEIGLRKNPDKSQQYEFSQQSGPQPNPNKLKNPMSYEQEQGKASKQKQVDLEQQFNKFFSKKPKTKFEQIRMHQQPEIRQMSESERIRRHFKVAYQKPEILNKAQYQKQYDTILDDQIKQKNRMYEDSIKQQKIMKQKHSEKGIKKMKWKVYALFFGAIIFTVPVLYSYVTKYKLEKEEEQKVRKIWDEMQRQIQQLSIRFRLKYQ